MSANPHRLLGLIACTIMLLVASVSSMAQSLPMMTGGSAEVEALIELPANLTEAEALDFFATINDREARMLLIEQWRNEQAQAKNASSGPTGLAVVMVRLRLWLERTLTEIGNRAGAVIEAAPRAPAFAATTLGRAGSGSVDGYVAALFAIVAGALLAWLAGRNLQPLRQGFDNSNGEERITLVGLVVRGITRILPVIVFAAVAIGGVSLSLSGAPKALISGVLTAAVLILVAIAITDLVMAPDSKANRLVPLSDQMAARIKRHFMTVVVIGAVFWTLTAYLILTGRPEIGIHLTYVLISGFAVFAAIIWCVLDLRPSVEQAIAGGSDNPFLPDRMRAVIARRWHVAVIAYLVATGLLWSAAMLTDRPSILWPAVGTLALVLSLPLLDGALHRAISWAVHRLSLAALPEVPTHGSDEGGGPVAAVPKADPEAYIELFSKAGRTILLLLTAIIILEFWGIDVLMVIGAPGGSSLWEALAEIFIILMVAWVFWQVVETAITRGFVKKSSDDPNEAMRMAARARTLLPLIRTFLLGVLIVVVVMVILSSLGVDIGPIIAGAGVVGIAIGFGAQTLVRDIFSGVFFLLDDAFRVGEYIEMEELRGEVEAITLRSLRLRHHRGHIFTVPYSELRFVTNYNRDWVIYKMPIRVPADTDPALVKKIIKQIGKDLLADPELGPKFIEPLKSQGVYAIDDDSALIIRVKFMCKPREQFMIRREAYHLIRRRFAEHGIEFARRKVEVSVPDGGKPSADQIGASVSETVDQTKPGPDPMGQ